jgi:hypothetical protein
MNVYVTVKKIGNLLVLYTRNYSVDNRYIITEN